MLRFLGEANRFTTATSTSEIFRGRYRPEMLQRSITGFVTVWEYPLFESAWMRRLIAAVVLSYCAARALVGLVGSRLYSHDAFWILDGAWRIMNGQRPQRDFSSMQGFLTYLPTSIGLWISGGNIWGFGYSQALMGVFLTIWIYFVARNRLLQVPLALMCLAVCFTAAAPFALGTSPFQLSPGLIYNRYGYCLLALVFVEAVTEARTPTNRRESMGGLSTGIITAVLLLFKITYFISALFLVVLLLPCKEQAKARWIGICAGFSIILVLCLAYYSFEVKPIIADLMFVAKSRHLRIIPYPADQTLGHVAVLLAFSVTVASLAATQKCKQAVIKIIIAGTVGTICGAMTIYGNYELSGFAMSPFISIVIADLLVCNTASLSYPYNLCKGALLLFGTAILSTVFFSAILSMGFGFYERFDPSRSIPHMHGARLSGFATAGDDAYYADFVNDGMDLLRRFRAPAETVMSLDFSNPFSYGLGIKPAPGGTVGWQYKYTFNDKYHLSPEFMFGRADLVMLPKQFSDGSLSESVPRIYGPYLMSHFHQIGESKDWTLYRHAR